MEFASQMFRRTSRQPDSSKDENPSRDKAKERDKETEKKLEKLLKKAKPFFDEKLKPKARLQALYSFLEAAQAARDTESQRRFFEDYDTTVYTVMSDAFWHQVDKIRALVQKTPERPPFVGTKGEKDSKEVADLLRILNVLRTLLLYSAKKFSKGWMRGSVAVILRTLLHHGNHPKIRLEGLRLLLYWLNDQEHDVLVPPGSGISAPSFVPVSVAKPITLAAPSTDADAVTDMLRLYEDAIPLQCFQAWPLPEPVEVAQGDGLGGFVIGGRFGHVDDDCSQTKTVRGGGSSENPSILKNSTSEVALPQNVVGAKEASVPLLPGVLNSQTSRLSQQRQESLELLEEILYNFILLAKAATDSTKLNKIRIDTVGVNARTLMNELITSPAAFTTNPSVSALTTAERAAKTKSIVLSSPSITPVVLQNTISEPAHSRSSSANESRPSSVVSAHEEVDDSKANSAPLVDSLEDVDVSLLGSALSAQQNLSTMWDLFARIYLKWLFPGLARRTGIKVEEGEGGFLGIDLCCTYQCISVAPLV
ncbi:hypothetical protein HDU93_002289 [Gonapodya sp. JEL0774]|nr:hypothetical protein HDU93_002289 [Gonapodya sp. JEL0774]